MTSSERPEPRSRPRRPADEGTDPVIGALPAQSATPGEPTPTGRRGPEPTVQLNVRVASDLGALIDHQANVTGRTKRQLIEQAIRNTYQ